MAEPQDDPVKAGMDHLQAAAREVIAATRSLLDAAEELVEDPKAVQGLVATLRGVASAAAARLRTVGPDADDGTDDEGGVEHIPVS